MSPPELLREGAITAAELKAVCANLVIPNDGTETLSEAPPTEVEAS